MRLIISPDPHFKTSLCQLCILQSIPYISRPWKIDIALCIICDPDTIRLAVMVTFPGSCHIIVTKRINTQWTYRWSKGPGCPLLRHRNVLSRCRKLLTNRLFIPPRIQANHKETPCTLLVIYEEDLRVTGGFSSERVSNVGIVSTA